MRALTRALVQVCTGRASYVCRIYAASRPYVAHTIVCVILSRSESMNTIHGLFMCIHAHARIYHEYEYTECKIIMNMNRQHTKLS